MNIYESIIGPPANGPDQIKAVAARLRGADDRSVLAMLSGDPSLGQVGQVQYEANQNQAQGLAKSRQVAEENASRERLTKSQMDQTAQFHRDQLEMERARLDQETRNQAAIRAQAAAQQAMMADYYKNADERARLAAEETARWHDAQVEAKRLAAEAKTAKEQAIQDRANDTSARMLGHKLNDAGITDLEGAMDEFDKVLGKYVDPETGQRTELGKKGIPGIGRVQSVLPMATLGDDAREIRTYLQGVVDRILKARSGAAVTNPEFRRAAVELGVALGQSEEDMINAYKALRAITTHTKHGIMAVYRPEVLDMYNVNYANLARRPSAMGAGSSTGRLATQRGTDIEVLD